MTSYHYIQSQFLTLDQVAAQSGVSRERLEEFQQAGCLPGPAYRVEGECRISSIFGEHEEPMTYDYYPSSYVAKAQTLAQMREPLDKIAEQEEGAFHSTYKRMLSELGARDYGLSALFDESGTVAGDAAEELLASEWQHYLNGTYGLCTKTASAEDIAIKEIMIARIKFLTNEGNREAEEVDLEALSKAVDALDAVSAAFASHEVKRSSRETYINRVRERYLET